MGLLSDSLIMDVLLRIEETIKKQNELLQELINIQKQDQTRGRR